MQSAFFSHSTILQQINSDRFREKGANACIFCTISNFYVDILKV